MLLVVAGLALCGLYRVISGTEHHAYSSGTLPPPAVRLTEGTSYHLAVRGGVDALIKRGAVLTSPACEWSVGGSAAQALTITPYDANSKATDAVGTFTAPFTGDLHIACTGWGPVFVDDADNTPADVAGWMLFFGVLALIVGGGLAVGSLRAASASRSAGLGRAADSGRTAGEDDEVQRDVDIAVGRVQDEEVVGPHGGYLPS